MKTMARTIMPMQQRWKSETSRMLLLLVVLALQLRVSSADVQDANEILIMPGADTQQQRHVKGLAIAEESVEEEVEQLSVGIPYHITVSTTGTITGSFGRTFHGIITVPGNWRTGGSATGTLLENGDLYNQSALLELTVPPPRGSVQTILFMNQAHRTVGVWSGRFATVLPAAYGRGSFIVT